MRTVRSSTGLRSAPEMACRLAATEALRTKASVHQPAVTSACWRLAPQQRCRRTGCRSRPPPQAPPPASPTVTRARQESEHARVCQCLPRSCIHNTNERRACTALDATQRMTQCADVPCRTPARGRTARRAPPALSPTPRRCGPWRTRWCRPAGPPRCPRAASCGKKRGHGVREQTRRGSGAIDDAAAADVACLPSQMRSPQ